MSHTELQLDTLNSRNLLVMQVYAERASVASAVAKSNAKAAAKAAKAAQAEQAAEDGESVDAEPEARPKTIPVTSEFDGWLERIDSLDDFDAQELTRVHGQLIALGFLKFEISGRSVGLRYKISTRGKNALERAVAIAARVAAGENTEEIEADFADAA